MISNLHSLVSQLYSGHTIEARVTAGPRERELLRVGGCLHFPDLLTGGLRLGQQVVGEVADLHLLPLRGPVEVVYLGV